MADPTDGHGNILLPVFKHLDGTLTLVDESNPHGLPLPLDPRHAPDGFVYSHYVMTPEYIEQLRQTHPELTLPAPAAPGTLSLDSPTLAFSPEPGAVVALDFDNTLSKNPAAFKDLVSKVHAAGGKAYLVTARPVAEKDRVVGWLNSQGIQLDGYRFFPGDYSKEDFESNRAEFENKMREFKSEALIAIGATDLIDDNTGYQTYLREENPEVKFHHAVTKNPLPMWDDSFMTDNPKDVGAAHEAALAVTAFNAVAIDKPVHIEELVIAFHEQFFDYYLRAPGQPDNHYVTDIGEQKVGFGSKYQLRKFLKMLQDERFTEGVIPPLNIMVRPIPTISEPVVRRLGAVEPPVRDYALTDADHQKRIRGEEPSNLVVPESTTDVHNTINSKPTGPMF